MIAFDSDGAASDQIASEIVAGPDSILISHRGKMRHAKNRAVPILFVATPRREGLKWNLLECIPGLYHDDCGNR